MIRKVGEAPLTVLQRLPYGTADIELSDLDRFTERSDDVLVCDLFLRYDKDAKPRVRILPSEDPNFNAYWNSMRAAHHGCTFLDMSPVFDVPEYRERPLGYWSGKLPSPVKSYFIESGEYDRKDRTGLWVFSDDRKLAGKIFDELVRELKDDWFRKPQVGQKAIFNLVAGRHAEYCLVE